MGRSATTFQVLLASLAAAAVAAGCGESSDGGSADGGGFDGSVREDAGTPHTCDLDVCLSDGACDDGTFCNGAEVCDPTSPSADGFGCVGGAPPCAEICHEDTDECGCLSDADCDDGLHCTGEEVCDPADPAADDDGCVAGTNPCDPTSFLFCNEDQDRCCSVVLPCPCTSDADCSDGQWCNGVERCDPSDPDADAVGCVSTSVSNICLFVPCDESRDCCEDTDGSCINTDPDPCPDGAKDDDSDGHRDPICGGDDCDDGDANRFPGNAETCDAGHDEDCDPTTLGSRDMDGDGFISDACCNEQNDGTLECGTDCDDGKASINPGEGEICNQQDDDCDGEVDEGVNTPLYRDMDGDGVGQNLCAKRGCSNEEGFVMVPGDCDDTNPAIEPGATECVSASTVRTCQSDGTWEEGACPEGTECVSQPNGTGLCQ